MIEPADRQRITFKHLQLDEEVSSCVLVVINAHTETKCHSHCAGAASFMCRHANLCKMTNMDRKNFFLVICEFLDCF